MVNIQLSVSFILGYTAPLASVIVSLPGITALRHPVGPIIFYVSALPSRTFFAGCIAGCSLPFQPTINTTKIMSIYLALVFQEFGIALFTSEFYFFFVLCVVFPFDWIFLFEASKAFFATEGVFQFFGPIKFSGSWVSTVGANVQYLLPSSVIPTLSAAIFLISMIPWGREHASAR